jgi:hypothetical protein
VALVIVSRSPEGIVRELVATLGSLVVLLPAKLVATIPSPGVMAFLGLDGLKVKATVVNPIL